MSQESRTDNDQLLAVAAEEFARKGLAGARVDAIAAAAGLNKATLYYRIGDKQALYEAVFERELGGLIRETEAAVGTAVGAKAQLRAFIGAVAASLGCAAPLLLREVADGGSGIPDHALDHMGKLVGLLRQILEAGAASGEFRPVNPFVIHMMIVGGLNLYAANAPIRERVAARHPQGVSAAHFITLEQAAGMMYDYILGALRP